MKKIMDHAISENVDEVYVTIYPKPELEYLISSFEKYGFHHIANKNHGDQGSEYVLVKDMRTFEGDIVKDYPFVSKAETEKRILAIKPDYHTALFPDSILNNEDPYDLVQDVSSTNSIHKIYICWMKDVDKLKQGDATTPRARPDTIRLRCGNVCASGRRPNGNSLTTHPPFSTIRRASARFASG